MRTKVYPTFDVQNETWNIIQKDNRDCLFYGDIDQVEQWLVDNADNYVEDNSVEYILDEGE